MILNHKEAIRYLVDNAQRISASFESICTLHYLLADGLLESKYAGKIRDHSVRIGGSTYIPFDDPKQLLKQLTRISEKVRLIHDPFEQSLFLLVHLSYLQAFEDVNKRTARLSANIPLITKNLVPLSFNDVDRDDYTSAIIAIYELQDVRPIVDLYAFSYFRTCAAYDATIQAIGFDEIRVRYRQQRRDILREIIVRSLVGNLMNAYIETKTKEWVPDGDQEAFMADLAEDLEHIDQNRIAGLGITAEQLKEWLKLRANDVC
ncbi:MAG: Fic family protein [Legionellales bacterium]